jgi:hypothetical protein
MVLREKELLRSVRNPPYTSHYPDHRRHRGVPTVDHPRHVSPTLLRFGHLYTSLSQTPRIYLLAVPLTCATTPCPTTTLLTALVVDRKRDFDNMDARQLYPRMKSMSSTPVARH